MLLLQKVPVMAEPLKKANHCAKGLGVWGWRTGRPISLVHPMAPCALC